MAVGQSFDWPGVYAARNRSMKYRAKAYEQLIRQDIIDKGLEVKLAAISYAKASMNHKILGDARNNFKELLDNLDRAFKRGETTILAYRKAQLQMMQIDTQLAEAENEISAAEAVLETFYPAARISSRAYTSRCPPCVLKMNMPRHWIRLPECLPLLIRLKPASMMCRWRAAVLFPRLKYRIIMTMKTASTSTASA